jgi:polyphosphate kinase 2 (PPK2 family)
MAIDLKHFERGEKFDGDYDDELKKLQERLARIQVAHIVHKKRSIVLFEGWDTAGKGGAIQRLTSQWDPRYFEVWPIAAPNAGEKDRHFLWRFWSRLPEAGDIAVFDRSWYGRVLVERVEGFATEAQWRRGYDEINEFEAQQKDDGTAIVKLFLHITQETQDERLAKRLQDPWKRWKVNAEDFRNRARRDDYLKALDEMFAHTDTRWSPWKIIDGNNKKAARIAALTHIADRLEAHVPMKPPAIDSKLMEIATQAIGDIIEKN